MDDATVTTVYNTLGNCVQAVYLASERAIRAKSDLEQTRLAAIRDGLIVGKNDEERKACAYEILKEKYRELALAEKDEREKKYLFDCAQIIVDQTRALMRLEEFRLLKRPTVSGLPLFDQHV